MRRTTALYGRRRLVLSSEYGLLECASVHTGRWDGRFRMNVLSPTARQNCLVGSARCFTLRTLSSQSAHFFYPEVEERGSRKSVIALVTRLRNVWYGLRKPARASPNHPHRLWVPHSLPVSKYRSSLLRIKQSRRDAGHWPPSNGEIKSEWSWSSNPHESLQGLFRVSLTSTLQSRIEQVLPDRWH
jgi:hypothetical protein